MGEVMMVMMMKVKVVVMGTVAMEVGKGVGGLAGSESGCDAPERSLKAPS